MWLQKPREEVLKKLSHQGIILIHPLFPQLPSKSIPFLRLTQAISLPVLPHLILISRKRCLSRMTVWSLISPSIVQCGSHKHQQKHPLPQEPREPGNSFSPWTLFPKGEKPRHVVRQRSQTQSQPPSRQEPRGYGRWGATSWQANTKGQDIKGWVFRFSQLLEELAFGLSIRMQCWPSAAKELGQLMILKIRMNISNFLSTKCVNEFWTTQLPVTFF